MSLWQLKAQHFAVRNSFVPIPGLPDELSMHVCSFLPPVIAMSSEKTIYVGKLALQKHIATVTSLEFNATGSLLLSSSLDGTIRVWNANDNFRHVQAVYAHSAVLSAVFHDFGTKIAALIPQRSDAVVDGAAELPSMVVIYSLEGAVLQQFSIGDVQFSYLSCHYLKSFGDSWAICTRQRYQDHRDQVVLFNSQSTMAETYSETYIKYPDFISAVYDMASFSNLLIVPGMNRAYCYKFNDPSYKRVMIIPFGTILSVAVNTRYIVFYVSDSLLIVFNRAYQRIRDIVLPGLASSIAFGSGDNLLAFYHKYEYFEVNVATAACAVGRLNFKLLA